jgi:hypothetical protein
MTQNYSSPITYYGNLDPKNGKLEKVFLKLFGRRVGYALKELSGVKRSVKMERLITTFTEIPL